MVSSCGAYGCTNRGEEKAKDKKRNEKNDETPNAPKNDATKPKLSFHSLPKNTSLREQWERNIRRGGKLPKSLVLCSEHFESSCFERDFQVNACLFPFSYPNGTLVCLESLSLSIAVGGPFVENPPQLKYP